MVVVAVHVAVHVVVLVLLGHMKLLQYFVNMLKSSSGLLIFISIAVFRSSDNSCTKSSLYNNWYTGVSLYLLLTALGKSFNSKDVGGGVAGVVAVAVAAVDVTVAGSGSSGFMSSISGFSPSFVICCLTAPCGRPNFNILKYFEYTGWSRTAGSGWFGSMSSTSGFSPSLIIFCLTAPCGRPIFNILKY